MAELATVSQLRPVRVLVASGDAAFAKHAGDQLTALGFEVVETSASAGVTETAVLQQVSVVLLDALSGITAAAAVAASLDGLPQRVHVLLTGTRPRPAARLGYEFIDRSASGGELAAAVHRARRDGAHSAGRSSRA